MTKRSQLSPFELIKPWEVDSESEEHRWAFFYLKNRKLPDFIFTKPSDLIVSRIEFLVSQFSTKNRNWVVFFSDSIIEIQTLSSYVAATFILSTGLPVEIKGPNELIDYAFSRYNSAYLKDEHPMESCSLLIIPSFDFMHPGYMKARPKIIELLTDRKMQGKPFMFSLFSPTLPKNKEDIPKFSVQLADFFGEQAGSLFSDNKTKFVILKN